MTDDAVSATTIISAPAEGIFAAACHLLGAGP